jgi:predicted DNA-binding transcriptional regulator AlpA
MLVTANQVCAMLQISLRTLWRMRSGRLLPTPVRLGSSVRWRRDEIQKWIEAGCPAEADCEK